MFYLNTLKVVNHHWQMGQSKSVPWCSNQTTIYLWKITCKGFVLHFLLLQNNKSMAAILSVNCQTILFGLCIGLLVYYVTRRLKYRLPPGPWCVPVIGNVQGKYTPVNSEESGQSISFQYYTVIDCGFGQQIRLRVKKLLLSEKPVYISLLYTFIFSKLPKAAGWWQQIRTRVKQNCCCQRNQSTSL